MQADSTWDLGIFGLIRTGSMNLNTTSGKRKGGTEGSQRSPNADLNRNPSHQRVHRPRSGIPWTQK